MDVDGVLTDGKLYYDENGKELKSFHIQDGHAIKMLREAGIKTGLLSGRKSKAAEIRAKELLMEECHLGISDKVEQFEKIIKKLGLKESEVAYMGDDLPDLPLLKRVGFSLSVPNGVDEVKDQVDWVTKRPGGAGAVREAVDFILSARTGHHKAKPVGFLK
ncbi:MAG: HAD hydrolase family protein [Nitrospirae bacterium]|nr:HAD hydrolase family protein [Nitrospirota bacterium]MBI3594674.1 HAD hydrolase family protein [Nitrospirota bacterium]